MPAINYSLKKQLPTVPEHSGVYLFSDKKEKIIYIGKAKNLAKRVNSYFVEKKKSFKATLLQKEIKFLKFILTDTEVEALLLENNLIKKHQPKFNVQLKDDSSFPYLKLSIADEFPRLSITRRVAQDGSIYFGPFAYAGKLKRLYRLLNRYFRLRTCSKFLLNRAKPCLEYDMGNCSAPCVFLISKAKYQQNLKVVQKILKGNFSEIKQYLKETIQAYAEKFEFEKARDCKELLDGLNMLLDRQKVVLPGCGDIDIFVGVHNGLFLGIENFFIRSGRLLGQHFQLIENVEKGEIDEIFRQVIERHYLHFQHFIPDEILINIACDDVDGISQWLKQERKSGKKIPIFVPKSGIKMGYIQLIEKNASHRLEKFQSRKKFALLELKKLLNLKKLPRIIEGFDISHTRGEHSMASLIHCEDGKLQPREYRLFKIKQVKGDDDCASLVEVTIRRWSRLLKETPEKLPDLLLIDGGTPQVNSIYKKFRDQFNHAPAIIGLAKKEEMLFLPQQKESIKLSKSNPALQLLISIRDECHRFALKHHRKNREKKNILSAFLAIPGIGPARATVLTRNFKTIQKLKGNSWDVIAEKTGFSIKLCEKIVEFLKFYP
ncbi:excinuclease ABC subunit UvrC [Candidatus Riflebacteria bacterium]